MFAIVCYDVQKKRDPRMLKTLRKYLVHVQKSVFEGTITEHTYKRMCTEIQAIISPDEDGVIIYHFEAGSMVTRSVIGSVQGHTDGFL